MSRDYAKRSTSRKKTRKGYRFLWLIILLLLLTLVTSVMMPDKYQEYSNKLREIVFIKKTLHPTPQTPTTTSTKTTETKKTYRHGIITKAVTTPKFDFYNILPQTKGNKDSKPGSFYELSIATVAEFVTADHLKAELALLGFAASITPVYQNNIQKHYISVGPYDSKDRALLEQKKLKENDIKSELKVVK